MKGVIKEKMKKEETKRTVNRRSLKERGITLVALVVTIIILLILSGVTLNIALSENGLFQRAKGTAKRYENASGNETEILDNLDKTLAELSGETGGIESSEVANNLKKYQGKYVDIGLDVTGTTATTDDWEIFYAGNGRIFLIAADYVPVTKLTEWNVIGDSGTLKDNGFKKDDDNYCVTWSLPTGFLTLPTTPNNFSSLVMHTGYILNQSNKNSIAVSHLLNTDKWKGIKEAASKDKQDYIDFVIGGPTLEMWCAAWKEAVEGDDVLKPIEADPQVGGKGYNVKYDGTSDVYMYVNGSTDSRTHCD